MEKGLNSEHSIIDILKNINCDTVFVIPGSLTNILYELDTNNIRIINAFHEEQLGFMAIGYYLQTGKIPVIIVSQGPGETNLVTSIASAYREQIPILILSAFQNDESQVYFQQTSGNYHTPNICGIMQNITDAYFLVAKKLGFARRGAKVDQALKEGLEMLLNTKCIVESDGMVRLPE